MTTVRFPTRVVLTVADDRLDEDLVALAVDATDAALRRAVRRAGTLDLVRASRADLGDVRVGVEIAGDALPADAVTALRRGLTAVATARALELAPSRASRTAQADDPFAGRTPAERFDARRLVLDPLAAVDDAYVVPSYDEGGTEVAVPVAGSGQADAQARPGVVRTVELRLVTITSVDDLKQRLADWYGTVPEFSVVMCAVAGRSIMVLVRCAPDGTLLGYEEMGDIAVYVPPTGEGEGAWHATSAFEIDAITFVAEATTDAERLRQRTRALAQHLRNVISTSDVTDADVAHQAAALARTMPRRTGATSYYEVSGNGRSPEIMEVDKRGLFRGTLPVAVLVEGVTVERPATPEELEEQRRALPLDELLLFEPDLAHPFLAEPPVEWWPPGLSARFTRLMAQVASALSMPVGRFPGMFLLAACVRIGAVAGHLGSVAGSGTGESPRLARLRTVIGAYAPMAELQQLYVAVVLAAADGGSAPVPLQGNGPSWAGHFYEEYWGRRDTSIRAVFVAECQDQLLDVLETSHRELEQRRRNLSAYLKVTRALVLLLLVDDVELSYLRGVLVARIDEERTARVVGVVAGAGTPLDQWWSSTSVVLGSMGHVDADAVPVTGRGALRRGADGWQVQDSVGRWWSRGELEAVISGGRQEAFAVDPFLEKLADLDDVIERMRSAGALGLEDEFGRLLDELREENEDKTRDVRDDQDIAFGMAAVAEAPRTELGAQLSGIHELADQALRPLFTGEAAEAYDTGLRALVGVELGKAAFLEFVNLVGLVALAIVCPEAAFVIGAVQAVDAVDTALEHRGIQRAMLGGDRIITHAQAEAELWGAAIGAALIFVPEVPGLLRGAARGVGAVVRGETREAASVAGREIAENMAKHVAELAAKDLLVTFARECLQGYLLNLAINAAINRFAQTIAREVEVTGHASLGDITRLVGDAIAGPAQVTP